MTNDTLTSKQREVLPELAQLNTDVKLGRASPSGSAPIRDLQRLTSPATSVSSKTAAFFGSSGSNTIRPASLSISSDSSSHALGDSIKDSISREITNAETSLWADSLSRYNSLQGSQRNSRLWENFEGKPVTPLPSPGGYKTSSQKNLFDEGFDRAGRGDVPDRGNTSRHSSWDRLQQRNPTQMTTSGSIASLPSSNSFGDKSASFHSVPDQGPIEMTPPSSSSKTTSFFEESRRILPAKFTLDTTSVNTESPNNSSPTSPLVELSRSNRRLPRRTDRLYEPSRLPSAEIGGFMAQIPASSSSAMATPTARSPNPASKASEELGSGTRFGILYPTTTIAPSSPLPDRDRSEETQAGSASVDPIGLSPPKARSSGRHVHGPSENATGSSFVPSTQQLSNATKLNSNTTCRGESSNGSANDVEHEESEDESTGRIGRYKIEKTLGVGAFSRVALASKRLSSRSESIESSKNLVALKMLEREPCMQNERMRVSWIREVEVLKHIVHPSIVRFLSSFSTAKHHTLVLESVGGGELFDFISNHHEKIAQREWLVRTLFGELANAVGWMHSINLVHRDIKLENILLTHHLFSNPNLYPSTLPKGPLLKISDFGLSRFIDPSSPLLDTRCGSEEYAAPELIIGKRYDGRKTDVWAMGVVLYALLSGSLPFLGLEDQQASSAEGSAHIPVRGYSRERGTAENGALARKAHLLRIAKGDLRWPSNANDSSADKIKSPCPIGNRLITPRAKRLVARLIRRDAQKRATAWEAWDEEWMTLGSIGNESSAPLGELVKGPIDPRSVSGQNWLNLHARVQVGASDLTHND